MYETKVNVVEREGGVSGYVLPALYNPAFACNLYFLGGSVAV